MRLTYSIPCVDGTPVPTLLHAADYYPYGSILRQHINGAQEKYLTTHHERDLETGLDYRGARYYDSDVARFLSLDPLAKKYSSWSAYNYVMGNPVSLVDPDGKSARCGCPNPPCQTDDPREEIVKKIDKAKPSADKASKAADGV
ncbi:MAG: RHS repeat-associated core domain-containing protein [Flavobacteriales bacterium]